MLRSVLLLFISLCVLFGNKSIVYANTTLPMPPGLEGRVEFWKLIFTKYGKHQRVFHNRAYPQVVYSVLDFSEYAASLSGKKLLRAKQAEIRKEESHIRKTLLDLASGKVPKSAYAKRIKRMYEAIPGHSPKRYRDGAKPDQIRYQTGIREKFRDGIRRSGQYLPLIEKMFRKQGLPVGLSRLPLIESSFDYTAYSSVGAAGIWQFMRGTGRTYSLRINRSLDERRDPVMATRAAVRYLRDAYERLRSWPLAVTSYNHGVAGMARAKKSVGTDNLAVIIQKYKSKTFGFASSNFYPELLAAIEVERNYKRYFPGLVKDPEVSFEEIKLGRSIGFSDLASRVNTSKSTLEGLNRSLKKVVLRGRRRIPAGTIIKVPYGYGDRLASSIKGSKVGLRYGNSAAPVSFAELEQKSTAPKIKTKSTYLVKRGDTLSRIARRYKTSVNSIMRANGIKSSKSLRAGKRIKIPGNEFAEVSLGSQKKRNTQSKKKSKVKNRTRSYRVKRGDTLYAIAKKHKTSTKKLMKMNGIKSAKSLRAGQKIKLP